MAKLVSVIDQLNRYHNHSDCTKFYIEFRMPNGEKYYGDIKYIVSGNAPESILMVCEACDTEEKLIDEFAGWLDDALCLCGIGGAYLDRNATRIYNALLRNEPGEHKQHNTLKTFGGNTDEDLASIRNLGKACMPYVIKLRDMAKREVEDNDSK